MQQKIFVITGPTGAGKTTIAHYLQSKYHMTKVITHTTRPPRLGEVDGQAYYFETPSTFAQKHYLEQVEYAGNKYGSSFEALDLAWQASSDATIVLDTKGAQTYAEKLGEQAVILFVTVSNSSILAKRLVTRGDDLMHITQRLASSDFQRDLVVPKTAQPTHVIVNDDLVVAKQQVDMLIKSLIKIN